MSIQQDTAISKIKYDGSITIATGRSRKETNWKNREMLWSELIKRLSQTTRTGETYAEYLKLSKSQQDKIKDVGGFVGGSLKGGRRKTDAVAWRQIVTLDADFIKGDIWDAVETMFDFNCAAYSTHKHSPGKPRIRLVIPLSRPVTPDEYQALSRRLAADIGIDFFDDTTYQPHRLMYWPSTAQDGEYVFKYQDEPWLDPDEVLARYPDWTDPSYWPESSRQKQARQRMADKQGDPHEKPGMVGAFCRTYSIPEAIETFLSDVYEAVDEGRYTYKEGSTTGGLVLYDNDKFAYSHHGTDPVGGQLVNSFDLVRIHKFGLKDEDAKEGTPIVRMPSYLAMLEFAQSDENVNMTLGEDNLKRAQEDFEFDGEEDDKAWLGKLERNSKGALLSEAYNVKLILTNDPNLKGKFALDDFAHRAVVLKDLPWRKAKRDRYWNDNDDAGLRNYLSTVYKIKGQSVIHDALSEVLLQNAFHPVRDYLNSLEWDGVNRLENLFIDYLGADDSDYVRTVTRKAFTAGVKRVMEPGCKYDYMPVLVGRQGIGKSALLSKMGKGWFSDSLDNVRGKEAYEQLQGIWLMEIGELWATKKAEVEAIKLFLSKQTDIFRVAYGRHTTVFPRQCIFFGTTNDMEFLRDKTGNRRFWPIVVGENEIKKNQWSDLTEEEIDQIWAEAVFYYQLGEELYLKDELEKEAQLMQEMHTEESSKTGIVYEFVERLLPEDWEDRDIADRRRFLDNDFGEMEEGTVQREKVCAMEIWVEALGGDPKNLTPMQAREINDILRKMPGWEEYKKSRGRLRFGNIYGVQRAFVRKK